MRHKLSFWISQILADKRNNKLGSLELPQSFGRTPSRLTFHLSAFSWFSFPLLRIFNPISNAIIK